MVIVPGGLGMKRLPREHEPVGVFGGTLGCILEPLCTVGDTLELLCESVSKSTLWPPLEARKILLPSSFFLTSVFSPSS